MRGRVVGDYWIGQLFNLKTPTNIQVWELRSFDAAANGCVLISVSCGRWNWSGPLEEFKKEFNPLNEFSKSDLWQRQP